MTTATERFLKYIAVNTTSVDDAKVYPSSPEPKSPRSPDRGRNESHGSYGCNPR